MCIQSYYNSDGENDSQEDLELDLLAEIKDIGIEKWEEKVEQAVVNGSDSSE